MNKSKKIEDLLHQNKLWAEKMTRENPHFFSHLANLQTPDYLWVGCSDSRVPANQITGLEPGEVFVHRNVANIVHPADLNFLSVLQYAVEVLKIKHIIVCGHYGCGGVASAVDGLRHGTIDHWLQPIRDIAEKHHDHLLHCEDKEDRLDRLCELNVIEQAKRISNTPIIQDAWRRKQQVAIHGWGLSFGRWHCAPLKNH